jgi:four helix bundle protein
MNTQQRTTKNIKRDILKEKMDELAYSVYKETKSFPKDEIFGITSQLRRAVLSIVLNYIEGYARNGAKEYRNFLKISYGSLQETKYLLFFSARENYLSEGSYAKLEKLTDEVGALLWTTLERIKDSIGK